MKNLRERVQKGELLFGCFLSLGSPVTAEIVGMAGFDWVLIDLEHGAGTERDALNQLQALEHTPVAAVVRVESHIRQRAGRVLDMGAHGIMFPRVDTRAEAERAAAALRYSPDGVRGVAMVVRAAGFGPGFPAYYAAANSSILGVLQIETEEAVRNVDEIAAVDGADVLFIGPSDLSQSMGIFGQLDHPRFLEALRTTAAAAAKHGKVAGILMRSAEEFSKYYPLGYRFLACGSDGLFLNSTARAVAASLSKSREQVSG